MSIDSRNQLNARPAPAVPPSDASVSCLGVRSAAKTGVMAALVVLSGSLSAQQLERISVDSAGAEGDAKSVAGVLSADGRTSAFSSYATNLVAGDTNGFRDVFVRDAETHTTLRVSLSPTGLQADGASYSPSLSADGRFLAFTSEATNLVLGDTNGVADVFVHDRDPDLNGIFDEGNGVNQRVSIDSFGREVHGGSYGAYSHTISGNGRSVVFRSDATDLVAGDGNGKSDIFVHDRTSSRTRRVSVDSSGAEANHGSSLATISGNGAVIAFHSDANNLVAGDTNGVTDVFTHELASGVTTRVSVDSSGVQYNDACSAPALSADGGVIAFRKRASSSAYSVYGLCVRDTATGSTQQLAGGGYSFWWGWWAGTWDSQWTTAVGFPAVSADGSKVAYMTSSGSAGVSCDSCPFYAGATGSLLVFDRSSQTTLFLATYSAGNFSSESQAVNWAPFYAPAMSDSGRRIAFESDAPDLVDGDTNGARDAFVWTFAPGPPLGTNYCTALANSTGQSASISARGSESVSAQSLSLQALKLPPGAFGSFFFGSATTNVPFGDGYLCVGAVQGRLPTTPANAVGIMSHPNVFAMPVPAMRIVAGSTYHFQAYYRDPAALLSGFNFTDGLTIHFVP